MAQAMPLDVFKEEMAAYGFVWVKEVGFDIFEHTDTGQVMPVVVERGEVPAEYVENARKICAALRGGPGPRV